MNVVEVTAHLDLTTPAMMFPAVSLLLLAYTNRFLALAAVVRNLSDTYQDKPTEQLLRQIVSLRARLKLIQWMQVIGVSSLLFSVAVMCFIYIGWHTVAHVVFGIALVMMIVSLLLSIKELHVSNEALNIRLSAMEIDKSSCRPK